MEARRVVVVGYQAAELLDIACVTTSLTVANGLGARPAYAVGVATPGGRTITCSSGLALRSGHSLERLRGPLDTLVVSGGSGHKAAAENPRIVAHVRRLARESRRTASVCTGATVLAAAGLLDGKRVTTHWWYAAELAGAYPQIEVDPTPIYIRDGSVTTAAGVTSALDLTLSFIEEDHGAELARAVARGLVTYLHRPGNQAQMSMFTTASATTNSLVRRTVDHIAAHLDGDLGTATLAAGAGVSERHLTRLFVEHLGETPGRFVRNARTEAAARLLTGTSSPLASVAARCGFGSAETLRQAFTARYGTSPSRYRATLRA
ncbi:GlxA family transcriptional regulator [Rhizohabitans arisaemae]|uniref:GlxA family transcriptional regulator n=1 Tax=Rhizohabitans arisaemae TaxID=2720610 RepID=UPI0024B2307E|nr:helix-turn-helix domain-containing protein [Rhizohabitans arisaemae]